MPKVKPVSEKSHSPLGGISRWITLGVSLERNQTADERHLPGFGHSAHDGLDDTAVEAAVSRWRRREHDRDRSGGDLSINHLELVLPCQFGLPDEVEGLDGSARDEAEARVGVPELVLERIRWVCSITGELDLGRSRLDAGDRVVGESAEVANLALTEKVDDGFRIAVAAPIGRSAVRRVQTTPKIRGLEIRRTSCNCSRRTASPRDRRAYRCQQ